MRAAARNWTQGTKFHSPVCWPASHTLRGCGVCRIMKIGIVKHYPDGLSATPAFGIVKHYPDGLSATPAMVSTDLSVYTVMYKYVCIYIYSVIYTSAVYLQGFVALLYCGDYCSWKLSGHWNPMLHALPWHFKSYPDSGTQCYMRCPDI